MEFLKNVLIKEVDGGKNGDKVVFVDNLPKSFLYKKAIKLMVDYRNPQQNLVPEFTEQNGRAIPTGATVDELLPGIEISQTGDEAFVFFVNNNESRMRLEDIDRYIQGNMPVTERIQPRVWYSSQPGVMTAHTRPLNQIPRVILPEPVSPPVRTVQVAESSSVIQSAPVAKVKKPRKPMTEEQKAAARQRMAVARATKAAKAE